MKNLIAIFALLVFLFSCVEKNIEIQSQELDLSTDPNLGRVLFYDAQLSLNNTISCSSCHKQAFAFADNARFSVGFEDKLTDRNSMPIQNLSNSGNSPLFWDGREHDLSRMVLRPIENHIEMGFDDFSELEQKLSTTSYYPELFKRKYGTPEITERKIGVALADFLSTITANNTKLDRSMQGIEPLAGIELEGQKLFIEVYDCNSCHQVQSPDGYLFAGIFANIGLDREYDDNGVGEITTFKHKDGMFKIPSLRNVALTAPYMHDGRFSTLEEVIDFYNNGVNNHLNLDVRLLDENRQVNRPQVTGHQKKAIIAFLNTLTDGEMITKGEYSNPFKTK